jgi:hypothetical protein
MAIALVLGHDEALEHAPAAEQVAPHFSASGD